MEVEHGLASARSDIDEDAVIVEPQLARRVGDEVEHPLRLVRRKGRDVFEGVDVALREDEEVRFRLWIDVTDGDEAVDRRNVVALANEPAEEAVVRQRGSLRS